MSRTGAGESSDPAQAPERSWAVRMLGPVGITGVFWYRFHLWGVRVAPRWLIAPSILVFTIFFFLTLRRIRRAIAANLEPVLGPCGFLARQRRIFRTMHQFAWCLTERYERLAGRREPIMELERADLWRSMATEGRGLLLVTGHVGNWEVGSALPAAREHRRVHLVREEEMDPRSQAFLARELAGRFGDEYVTHFAAGDPRLGLRLLEALRSGEVVALQADRPRRGGRTLGLRLLGRPFPFPAGPLVLAREAGVPLLPVFVLRTGRLRYRLCFRPPVEVARDGDRAAALAEAGQRVAAEVEWAIRQAPNQWFCFRPLWDDQVPSAPR